MKNKIAYFYWDWKNTAPISEIVRFVSKNPKVQAWDANQGDDCYHLILAKTQKEALECWKKENKEWLKEIKDEAENPEEYYPNLTLWKD
jgi:hypothetical protein